MKIVDVTTTELVSSGVPQVEDGTSLARRSALEAHGRLFVHIKADDGLEGLGIGQNSPGVRQVVETELKHLLIDQEALDIERLWDDMFKAVRGYGRKGVALCAISAVDIGLWDLKAKALGLPLYKLLGPYTDSVPIYGSGGRTNFSEDELVTEMVGYVELGIKRVKMKVGKDFGQSEREDIQRLAAVRKALGDDVAIYVDANNGYHSKQAIYMAREFEQYQAGWFEEPVLADDIPGLSEVRRAVDIPVASGEHEYTKYGFKELIAGGGADIVQPDVGRVGGVTEWMKVAHMAQAFNLPVAPHAKGLVSIHLCCAIPNLKAVEYLNDEVEAEKPWYTDYPQPKDGMWSPFSDRPGLGLELDPYAVERWAV